MGHAPLTGEGGTLDALAALDGLDDALWAALRLPADTVPREDMPQAITAVSIAWNSARALGPSIAGFVFAWLGAGFAIGACCPG